MVLVSRERRAPPLLQHCTPTPRRPPPRAHVPAHASLMTEGPLPLGERSAFSKAGAQPWLGWPPAPPPPHTPEGLALTAVGALPREKPATAEAGEAVSCHAPGHPPLGPVVRPPVPPVRVSLGTGTHASLRAEGARADPEVPGGSQAPCGARRPFPAAPRLGGSSGSGVTRTAAPSTETQLASRWRRSPWPR